MQADDEPAELEADPAFDNMFLEEQAEEEYAEFLRAQEDDFQRSIAQEEDERQEHAYFLRVQEEEERMWTEDPIFDPRTGFHDPKEMHDYLWARHIDELAAKSDGKPQPWLSLPIEILSRIAEFVVHPFAPQYICALHASCREMRYVTHEAWWKQSTAWPRGLAIIGRVECGPDCGWRMTPSVLMRVHELAFKPTVSNRHRLYHYPNPYHHPLGLPVHPSEPPQIEMMMPTITEWIRGGSLRQIRHLDFRRFLCVENDPTSTNGRLVRHFPMASLAESIRAGGLPNLKRLCIQETSYGPTGMRALAEVLGHLEGLEWLLAGGQALSTYAPLLEAIGKGALPQLKVLDLSSVSEDQFAMERLKEPPCGIEKDCELALKAVERLANLEALNLCGNIDIDSAIAFLTSIKMMRDSASAVHLHTLGVLLSEQVWQLRQTERIKFDALDEFCYSMRPLNHLFDPIDPLVDERLSRLSSTGESGVFSFFSRASIRLRYFVS